MSKAHAFIQDLDLWISELESRPEVVVLHSVVREYQLALLALVSGHYRSAFGTLRLALELAFSAVQWSANERELREWLQGQRDSNWATLIDNENGILSKQFVRLFCDGLANEAGRYRSSAVAVYRECSEYVHGNSHTHRLIPAYLIFDEASFDAWHQKASVVRLTISFAFAARYLLDIPAVGRSHLENTLLDHLGHSGGIRAILGASTEVTNG